MVIALLLCVIRRLVSNKLGEAMMDDLYKETVDFEPNFDNTLTEPKVMPTRIPNLFG